MTSRPGSSSFHLFFIALAVTDILVLVLGLFPEWIAAVSGFHLASLNVGSCKITYWLAYSVELLSPWFLVAMTFQRAVTVVWPHHRHATCSRRQAHVTIVAMAAACLGLNSWVLYARTTTVSNGKVVCGWKPDYLNYGFPVVMWFNFALYSLIPYIIIAFSNTLLIRKVLRSARRTGTINRRPSMSKLSDDKHSRMTLTLITVSMVFVVLTFPTFIMDIVGSEMKDCSEIPEFLLLLGTVGNALAIVIMRKMSSGSSVFPTLFIALAVADLGTLYLGLLPEWLGVQFGFWVMNSSEGVCKTWHLA
nr:hypothetical protein BaRGS_011495 [Batillaria attramentaria]